MCGICGHTRDPEGAAVSRMNELLVHRGPDDEGHYVDRASGVALGARRLSIIDLPGGHQPLSNEDGSVWVTFNGEIYNHAELRERLRRRGHEFATESDTEVLVHLYEELGDDLLHAVEGMFAFGIWDTRNERLLLARDRFGEKPLFYRDHGGELAFASELGALIASSPTAPDLDPEAVNAFFVFGYVPGPGTLARGIATLPPGHLLVWKRGSAAGPALRRYWSSSTPRMRPVESFQMLTAETSQLLRRSIRDRLVADVPVGVLLSGGVDSSVIAALAAQESTQRLATFTVGYDVGNVDERRAARRIAAVLDADHHELVLTQEAVQRDVPMLLRDIDQPLADQALVPLHAISKFARSHVKVAVGGEGADEIFAGYPRYASFLLTTRLGRLVPSFISSEAIESMTLHMRHNSRPRRVAHVLAAGTAAERHIDWVTSGRRHVRERLYGPSLGAAVYERESFLTEHAESLVGPIDGSVVGRLMHLDQQRWLPDDVLVKSDRASMLVGLEMRAPYLDREVAEFAASLDTGVHLRRDGGKVLLRRILAELIPSVARERRPKIAFRAPASEWLRGPLVPAFERQLERGSLFDQGWFDRARVRDVWRAHRDGHRDAADVLWPLLAFGVWLDGFVGADVD